MKRFKIKLILLFFLMAGSGAMGQTNNPLVHDLHERIIYLENAVWGNSDYRQLSPSLQEEVELLKKQNAVLTRLLTETKDKLDSLVIEMNGTGAVKRKEYVDPPYWTIWFTMNNPSKEFSDEHDRNKCRACDSMKYQPLSKWVQSFNDSTEAYEYYWHLKSTGKVLMWEKYECGIDPASVYIDKYSMQLRQYLGIKQPDTTHSTYPINH
jgi:hypothetical protein